MSAAAKAKLSLAAKQRWAGKQGTGAIPGTQTASFTDQVQQLVTEYVNSTPAQQTAIAERADALLGTLDRCRQLLLGIRGTERAMHA